MAQLRVGTASRGPVFDVSITSVIPAPRDPTPLTSVGTTHVHRRQIHADTLKIKAHLFKN